MSWASSVRLRIRHAGERTQKVRLFAVILGLIIPGSALLVLSLSQDVTHVDGSSLSGSLAVGQTLIPLGWPVHSYSEVAWSDPACGVRFYFLTPEQFRGWENGSAFREPTLTCDRPIAVFPGSASHAVAVNDRGPGVNYTIRFDLFLVKRPLAWLSLPAVFMLFGATIATIAWFLGAAVAQELDHLARERESKRR